MFDAKAPPVPLVRLRSQGPGELDLYYDLFAAAGGSLDDPVSGGSAYPVLASTRLPQQLLQKIWAFADEFSTGTLDWEGFCVACRLCAHVQQALEMQGERAAEEAAEGARVAEIPTSPPWFEGYEQDAAPTDYAAPRHIDSNGKNELARRFSNGSNDFEALAFGSSSTAETVRPAGDLGKGSMPILPMPSSAGHWQGGVTSGTGGFLDANNATGALGGRNIGDPEAFAGPDATPSAAILMEKLNMKHFESSSSSSPSKRRADVKRTPSQLLVEELAKGRQRLEENFAGKARLQRRIENMRQRLESMRSERQQVVAELTSRQCDVQHLYAEIEFSRTQIEEVERDTGHMRVIRKAFTHEDVARMEKTRFRFQAERISLGDDVKDMHGNRRAMLQMSHDMLAQDRKNIAGLSDKLRRPERRKQDLQKDQLLLLEDQRTAEEDRDRMLYALEVERVKLMSARNERMDIGFEMRQIQQEAQKLSRDSGVEPAVFAKCFLPEGRDPPEMKEPLDPIAAVPLSTAAIGATAWGPAAEHLRREDVSSWRKNVYQQNVPVSDAGFSVSGGYTDPTSMQPWAKFGKGGQKVYAHSKHHGGNILGVPTGQETQSISNIAR